MHLGKTAEVLLCKGDFGKLGVAAVYSCSEYHISEKSLELQQVQQSNLPRTSSLINGVQSVQTRHISAFPELISLGFKIPQSVSFHNPSELIDLGCFLVRNKDSQEACS